MQKVMINCDMGESFGIYRFGSDEEIMPYVTHANIACGFHASDPSVMWRTVRAAKAHGIKIGSHPGLPDREGFGRREMKLSRNETAALILYQTGALRSFLDAEGVPLEHIKPHGALMGMATHDQEVAEGIADAALIVGVPVSALANTVMTSVFENRGLPFFCEFVSDLEYDDNGNVIITVSHDPVPPHIAARRALRAVTEGLTKSVNGKDVKVAAESICLHSDTPGALEVAKAVREALASFVDAATVRSARPTGKK